MTATVARTSIEDARIRLTDYARCAGCAAKMGASDLSAALSALRPRTDPRLLVGHSTFDDAAVFELSPGVALIQTVDFFAPIVDDPYDFGRVAAANALSDVYAMGGEPLTALAITAFPTGKLPTSVLGDILRGGESIVHEAEAFLVGGHTITDDEIKFGLAVTGRANPDRLLTNAGAKPGDTLLLTKGIGTGILATQAKRGRLDSGAYTSLVRSMTTLNAIASRIALAVGARCATDVTGFGLLGHAFHIARASNVTVRIEAGTVPLLDGVEQALADGARTGGAERNERFVADGIQWNDASDEERAFLLDPQTSGGLMIALPHLAAEEFRLQFPQARVIGSIVSRGDYPLVIA
jgi:selenide, water dikinase